MSEEPIPRVLARAGVTPREREVFWLVADRLRNREIADRLSVSERTVESHVASLLRKLGGSDRSDLEELARRLRESLGADRPLPEVLSSFTGRQVEVLELGDLVGAHRLVTLTGPAGVGKTRLALQVARSSPDLPPPILVDLATVTAGDELDRVFATTIGLVEDDRGLRAALRAALRDDRHWLLVDNCEHVLSAAAGLVRDLLSAAPGLRVLTTSRSPLQVPGEVVYEVAPLPLPPEVDDPDAVAASPSARLFGDRAATASPGFAITTHNARAVATLCRHLDGLPLAIELAAARIRMFAPAELLARLDHRFQFLDAGRLDGSVRHSSLEAALGWSYELLREDERMVFERCSVFPGEFDYDTAAAVVAYPPLDPGGFARAFPRLLDGSLLSRRRLADQTTSYRMLETFRAFGRQQLERHDGAGEAARRHAEHHLDRATDVVLGLRRSDARTAARWFDERWVDVATAMRWALASGETDRAWRFLTDVGRRWDYIGLRGEVFDWLEDLLARPFPPGELGIRARTTASCLLVYVGPERAVHLAEEALELTAAEQDGPVGADRARRLHALAELALGFARSYQGDRAGATAALRSTLEGFREQGDRWHEAVALQGLGHAASDADTMIEHVERAAQLFGDLQDLGLRANCLTMLAARAVEMDEDDRRIEGWLTEASRLAELTGNTHERLHAQLHRARLDQRRGDHAAATPVLRDVLPSLRRIGDQRCACRCLLGLGWAALAEGDLVSAREHLAASAALADEVTSPREAAAALRLLARLELDAERPVEAARLLGASDVAAEHLERARRDGLPSALDVRERIEQSVGSAALRSGLEEGRTTPPAELLAALP